MQIINMTPHAIVVKEPLQLSGCKVHSTTYEPSDSTIRLEFESTPIGEINGFDVCRNILVGHNLPEPELGVILLVSTIVLTSFPDRDDLLAPDTNNAVRDDKGHIVSVPGFIAN